MGADMLVWALYWKRGQKLDWKAGEKALKKVKDPELSSYTEDGHGETFLPKNDPTYKGCRKECLEWAKKDLDELQSAITDLHRESAIICVAEYDVLVTGGQSWGDSPTDLSEVIGRIGYLPSVLQAIGFLEGDTNAVTIG